MFYEIINPSDPYTLKADDFKIDEAATILLGQGYYGLKSEDGKQSMPILLFGGETYLKQEFGDLGEWPKEDGRILAVADCLDTVMSLGFRERFIYEEKLKDITSEEARKEYRTKIHEISRGSLNDIGSRAWELAEAIRDGQKKLKQQG